MNDFIGSFVSSSFSEKTTPKNPGYADNEAAFPRSDSVASTNSGWS